MNAIASTLLAPTNSVQNMHELSQVLQRRALRLMLLYDQYTFHGQLRTFYLGSTLAQNAFLQQYDNYIKLRTYSDELLEDIMPRIRRQLSLQTSQHFLYEDAPTRGIIDWQRTLQHSWNEYPGYLPFRFVTQLQQQSIESLENVFTVTILLYYNRRLQDLLQHNLQDEEMSEQERETLTLVDDRIQRELAAPYVGILRDKARYAIDNKYLAMRLLLEQDEASLSDDTIRAAIDLLAEQVEANLRLGPNAYRDLITWWQQFSSLTQVIQQRSETSDPTLYHLWLILELLHLLYKEGTPPLKVETTKGKLVLTFSWPVKNGRTFRFIYHEQSGEFDNQINGWQSPPCLHSPFRIERLLPLEVKHKGKVIWREPPVLLDTLCTFAQSHTKQIDDAIKLLLGDMRLLDAEQGILFSPWLPDPSLQTSFSRQVRYDDDTTQPDHRYYHPGTGSDISLHLYQLNPTSPSIVQSHLRAFLDVVVENLWKRPAIGCHGVWFNPSSTNASDNTFIDKAKMILCPKPHIGTGVFDLVNPYTDCHQNPHLCHVIELLPDIDPPWVSKAATEEEAIELGKSARKLYEKRLALAKDAGKETEVETLSSKATAIISRMFKNYVFNIRGDTMVYEDRLELIFGRYWNDPFLSKDTRDILTSGECLWYDLQQKTKASDWSPPAVQYLCALEFELKQRLYKPNPPGRSGYDIPEKDWTLGTPHSIYTQKDSKVKAENEATNIFRRRWHLLSSRVEPSGESEFENKLMSLYKIADKRNKLVIHGGVLAKNIANELREEIIGTLGVQGLLPWFAQHLKPGR